jgi:hypothetical protein
MGCPESRHFTLGSAGMTAVPTPVVPLTYQTAFAPVTGLRKVRLAVAVHVGPARRATRLDPLTAIRHN